MEQPYVQRGRPCPICVQTITRYEPTPYCRPLTKTVTTFCKSHRQMLGKDSVTDDHCVGVTERRPTVFSAEDVASLSPKPTKLVIEDEAWDL